MAWVATPFTTEALASLRWRFDVADARAIPSAPGYAVSICGRVFSNRCGPRSKGTKYTREKKYHELKPQTRTGYALIGLCVGDALRQRSVHRIVAECYLPPPESRQVVVRHLDGDSLNNHADNLAWGTHADNAADRQRHLGEGRAKPARQFTAEEVRRVRERYARGCSQTALAAEYGVLPATICNIVNRKTWKHLV